MRLCCPLNGAGILARIFKNDTAVTETKLALAVTFYQQGKKEQGLKLAKQALGNDLEYADLTVLEENLWGSKLLKDTETLLSEEQIKVFIVEVKKTFELNQQAIQLYKKGRYGEAEPLYTEALAMYKRLFPDDHPDVATSLNNLAELYRAQGRYGEAEPLYTEALAMKKRLFPDDHPDVATSLNKYLDRITCI
ncbi:MAG: tetratricopeptide repeat protein [Waterburya sp.]